MVPGCDQPAVVVMANDAPLMSPKYAERCVCRWHERNPFPATTEAARAAGGEGE